MSMDNGKINPIDFDALYDSMRKCRKGGDLEAERKIFCAK